jgi:aryl-alcohol dehydrogenase-like predicted oxidoreductase
MQGTQPALCTVATTVLAPVGAIALLLLLLCAHLAGEDPDCSADRVRASIKASMQRLGVDYIDILHCHDIEFCPDMQQVSRTATVAVPGTTAQRLFM